MAKLLYKDRKLRYSASARSLVSDGNGVDCCCGQGGRMCARAWLCENTPDYETINPKSIVFTCPESGFLCTSPPGKWLVQYKGYCYQPIYNEDGSLVCSPNCGSGGNVEDIGNPVGKLTCLPGVECDESPCIDPYVPPGENCCNVGPITLEENCPRTDPPAECNCGKRWIVLWWGEKTFLYWSLTGVHCTTEKWKGSGARVTTQYGQWCTQYDIHRYGGYRYTKECHSVSADDYCDTQCVNLDEWNPFVGGTNSCGDAARNAIQPWFTNSPGGFCRGDQFRACDSNQSGIDWSQRGTLTCGAASVIGHDYRYELSDCFIREKWDWVGSSFVQVLIPCDTFRPGEAPKIGAMELM